MTWRPWTPQKVKGQPPLLLLLLLDRQILPSPPLPFHSHNHSNSYSRPWLSPNPVAALGRQGQVDPVVFRRPRL